MGFFSKLFGGSKDGKTDVKNGRTQNQNSKSEPSAQGDVAANAAKEYIQRQKNEYDALAAEKKTDSKVSEQELAEIFNAYFAPNTDFFMEPGSAKYKAYFNAVNTARDEMFRHQRLFTEATNWSAQDLAELVNNPVPGLTNMYICGLIFKLGQFAVIKQTVYCVDFSEAIPNCVALYLLLIAQKQPVEKRKQLIDAGDGTNKQPLTDAMEALKVCDPDWDYRIW